MPLAHAKSGSERGDPTPKRTQRRTARWRNSKADRTRVATLQASKEGTLRQGRAVKNARKLYAVRTRAIKNARKPYAVRTHEVLRCVKC